MKANFINIWYPNGTEPDYNAIVALRAKIKGVLYNAKRWGYEDQRLAEQRLIGALDTLCILDMLRYEEADKIFRVVSATATKFQKKE